ncbi:hypothetical protein CY34DRAFT_796855 [Suillus luteus UH-Slu-Lm8-n1]|uniref:Uncharacterized protein n=1 Tax=Suillus luteus UH-Slu-Lm8-n1 TaxID=930992 RepID=A0A0D0AH54_9AGAM|nr:hypothetical protein CY34DRAFT_796855 [Suillus luteus UH-Slu-Lm8-n1]
MNVAAQIMENSSFADHPVAREDQGTCLPGGTVRPQSIRWTILTVVCGSGDHITDTAWNMLSFRKTGSLPSCGGPTQSHMERYVVNHAFLLAYNVSTTFFTYTLCKQRRSMLLFHVR